MVKGVPKIGTFFIRWILFFAFFSIGLNAFIISPLLPVWQEAFGFSESKSGWLVGGYSCSFALFAFLFAPRLNRVDRKKVLALSLCFLSVLCLLLTVVPSYEGLLTIRILMGVAAAAINPQIWALLAEVAPHNRKGRSLGLGASGLAISQAVGLPLGTLVSSYWDWTVIFQLLAILTAVMSIILWRSSNRSPEKTDELQSPSKTLREVLSEPRIRNGLWTHFFIWCSVLGLYSYLGVYLSASISLEVYQIGGILLWVGVGNLIGNVCGGWLSDWWGHRKITIFSIITIMICTSLFSFVSHAGLASLFIFCWYFGVGSYSVSFMSQLAQIDARNKGTILSINSSVMYLGIMAGSLLGGYILEWHSFRLLTWILAGTSVTALFFYYRMIVTNGKHRASDSTSF